MPGIKVTKGKVDQAGTVHYKVQFLETRSREDTGGNEVTVYDIDAEESSDMERLEKREAVAKQEYDDRKFILAEAKRIEREDNG